MQNWKENIAKDPGDALKKVLRGIVIIVIVYIAVTVMSFLALAPELFPLWIILRWCLRVVFALTLLAGVYSVLVMVRQSH